MYDEAMRSTWAALAAACRTDIHTIAQIARGGGPPSQLRQDFEDSRRAIERLLADAAVIARGEDATFVEVLDRAHNAHLEPGTLRRAILTAVDSELMIRATTAPADLTPMMRRRAVGHIQRTIDDNY